MENEIKPKNYEINILTPEELKDFRVFLKLKKITTREIAQIIGRKSNEGVALSLRKGRIKRELARAVVAFKRDNALEGFEKVLKI